MFLNDEPGMVTSTIIDINPIELTSYPLMISLNKCTGIFNGLSPKTCLAKETKDIDNKAFNTIANKDEAKAMTQHISCDYKCKFNSTTCSLNQKWNNKTCQSEFKNYNCEKDYSWNPRTCICENNKYLESVTDNSVTECDEIVTAMDNLSTKKENAKATKVKIL